MNENIKRLLEETEEWSKRLNSVEDVEDMRVKILGKKGSLTEIMKVMKELSPEERKSYGQAANEARAQIEARISERMNYFKELRKQAEFEAERIDVTEPGRVRRLGSRHLVSITIDEISKIFMNMGFSVAEGPEVETVFNNFDALNAGPNHPARDMSDTFYITKDVLLRTQTSCVQIRTLENTRPPIKVIAPGRCFRCDTPDATHSPMFHQVEGLVVGENITMADLKGVLDSFAKQMFGSDVKTKFRPHHFPFTEPSAEMDISCFICGGEGCGFCKHTGWVEILGCGMVDPNVLDQCGIDSTVYSGYAFGMGVERITNLKYRVSDLRLFSENDTRFLQEFESA